MKVILTEDIKNLGQKGDEKEVKIGYARNFLFVKKFAVPAESTEGKKLVAEKELKEEKKQAQNQEIAEIVFANQGLSINYKKKASKEGKLFGGVSTKEIKEDAEKKLGAAVESINPNKAVKTIGSHKFTLSLKGNHLIDITVIVSELKK